MSVFRMPSLGSDMESGTLVEWLVAKGDEVKRGDTVAVVETQKGAIEIDVFEGGKVHALTAELGAELPVGAPLAVILGAGETVPDENAPDASAQPPVDDVQVTRPEIAKDNVSSNATDIQVPSTVSESSVPASPAARLMARQLGLNLAGVEGTGPGGVIVVSDVERMPKQATNGADIAAEPSPKPKSTPMAEMRKAIAAAMTRSKQTIPHFYLTHTIDLQAATDFLADRNAGCPPAERILMGALFLRAAARAAASVKTMNGHYANDAFQSSEVVNPGVAIALRGGGLVAPALMDALALDLAQTMDGMRDLVSRARAGRLKSSEMTEGTITMSSLGDVGAEAMTGVIFPPQVALVGVGAPQTRPWVVEGEVIPRRVVTVTLSSDHRVSDGRAAARFLSEFETQLQNPETL